MINIKLTRWEALLSSEDCMVPWCYGNAELKLVEIQESIDKRFQPVEAVQICANCLNQIQTHAQEHVLFRILNIRFERYVDEE